MANPRKDPFVGTRIREYEVLSVIGKGGMGAVYKARHVYLDEERAIKVIQTSLAEDSDFVERFIREAKILSKLRHPNLVQLYEFGTLSENTFFMVMEFIRGESVLERLHRKTTIPINESIRIIRQAALGLHSAHQKGIIHRDISPDNLMLVKDESGEEITKVLDFGIAKPLAESTRAQTVTNMFLGKPEYSSPEQCGVLEEGEIIDRRSDIYSLGVTLYYMCVGKLPFYSATPQGYLLKHASEKPKAITSFLPAGNSAETLDRILQKALSKRREDRYSTMEEFARELEQVVASEQNLLTQVNPPEPVAADVPIRLEPGNIFARRYLIEKKLGEGGMGAVFKATDKILEVPVALKVMSNRVVQDDITLERFKREVILARKVAHPNACRIYDIGESQGVHYVSMEYVEGKTLAEMLQDGRLPVEVGLPIIEQVLEALNEAHRVGIVHRDLKPQNIMVDTKHRAHILDFGISISADARRVTQTGLIVGTPHYMSPEQFEGKNVDHRSDIYSIGVIMYEMLSGKLPFEGTTPMAIIYAHLKSNPSKLTDLVPEINPQLERIIFRCLEKDVGKRYQNVHEVISQIEPLTQGSGSGVSRERLAHKFLAERSYSKAIKFLNSMLETDPANQQYKKLLHIAVGEKVRRDLHRAKSLIRKDNLVQAQLLLEKISRFAPKTERVVSQVRKLEKFLSEERQKKVEQFLGEANSALEANDWNGALAKAQSAWNLNPNNQRIAELQDRIQRLQQQHLQEQVAAVKQDYGRLLQERSREASYLEEEALKLQNRLDPIVQSNPGFKMAEDLRAEIYEFGQFQKKRGKISRDLENCLQPLLSENYQDPANRISKLAMQIPLPAVQQELFNIEKGIREMGVASGAQNFEEVQRLATQLIRQDSGGWLAPYGKYIDHVRRVAEQKEAARRKYNALFERGKNLSDERRWEEAARALEDALAVNAADSVCRELLDGVKKKIAEEHELRTQLTAVLNDASRLVKERKFPEARERLDHARERMQAPFVLNDLQQKWKLIDDQLQGEVIKENARRDLINREFAEASSLYERRDFKKALQIIERVLKNEPAFEQARTLQARIESGLKEEEQTVRTFRQTFDEGKKHFDSLRWERAIECWKKALSLSPNNPAIGQWIEAAQSRLDVEQQLRNNIISCLNYFDQELANRKLEAAKDSLNHASGLITNEYQLGDLEEQIQEKRLQLQRELDKENRRLAFIKRDIDEATTLYEREEYDTALKKISELLKVEPDSQAAIQLEADIRNSIQQKDHDVVRTIAALVDSISAGQYSEAPAGLQSLQSISRNSSLAPQAESAHKDLASLIEHLQSGDFQNAKDTIQKASSPLLASDKHKLLQIIDQAEQRKLLEAEFTKFFEEGASHFSAGNWQQAIAAFDRAGQLRPGDARIRDFQNQAKSKLREVSEIRERIQDAGNEAETYIRNGRLDKAIALCRKTLSGNFKGHESEIQNDLARLREQLALAEQYQQSQKQATASPSLEQAVSVKPSAISPVIKIAVPLAALFIGIVLFLLLRPSPAPPLPMEVVTINAIPWANVKIVPASEESKIPEIEKDETTTPCNLSLPAGEYTIQLDNGGLTAPLTQKIKIEAGKANSFFFKMPSYDPRSVLTTTH